MRLAPLGDSAVVVTLGSSIDESTLLCVRLLAAELELEKSPAIIDVVPAYTTVTVFYEVARLGSGAESPYDRICLVVSECVRKMEGRWPDLVRANMDKSRDDGPVRTMEIPVCYGGAFGPDIEEVANHGGVTTEEVVELHSSAIYDVHAIGFTPGFPYLAGLIDQLHTPRRASPRVSVPAGSIGIGGRQTGVYPITSPGGWQLIGRTPRPLFDVGWESPALLRVGDRVRFEPISEKEFFEWK
jgi:inhibitor of KinA